VQLKIASLKHRIIVPLKNAALESCNREITQSLNPTRIEPPSDGKKNGNPKPQIGHPRARVKLKSKAGMSRCMSSLQKSSQVPFEGRVAQPQQAGAHSPGCADWRQVRSSTTDRPSKGWAERDRVPGAKRRRSIDRSAGSTGGWIKVGNWRGISAKNQKNRNEPNFIFRINNMTLERTQTNPF